MCYFWEGFDISVFGPEITGTANHEVDTAALIQEDTGLPAQKDDNFWTAFVSSRQVDEFTFIPVFRWVEDWPPGPGAQPAPTPAMDVPDEQQQCYCSVKCDAIMLSDGRVELAVCYMYRTAVGADWDIGVTRLVWPSDQPLAAPPIRFEALWDDGVDESHPDLAYDPQNGEIYLVYSEDTDVPVDPFRSIFLRYRRFDRNTLWTGEYWALRFPGNPPVPPDHNMHMPRIDVGLVDDILNVGGQTQDIMGIGIAYTSQNHNHNGFHIHVLFWARAVGDGDKLLNDPHVGHVCLRNWADLDGNDQPEFWWMNAGLPHIDISPMANEQNEGSIVFCQNAGADLFGPVFELWEINSVTNDFRRIAQTQEFYFGDSLYPSVAIHYSPSELRASVTCLRQRGAQTMQYVPWVAQINLDDMDFPVIAGSFGDVLPPWLPAVYGIYNTDQIPFIHPGAASSICVTANNSYWAAWCEGFQMEPPPSRVHAAWGNTAL